MGSASHANASSMLPVCSRAVTASSWEVLNISVSYFRAFGQAGNVWVSGAAVLKQFCNILYIYDICVLYFHKLVSTSP